MYWMWWMWNTFCSSSSPSIPGEPTLLSTNDDDDDRESLGSMIHNPHRPYSMRMTRTLRSMWFPPATRVEIPQRQQPVEEEEENAMMMMVVVVWMVVWLVIWMVILIIIITMRWRRKMMMVGCRSQRQLLDGGGCSCWWILPLSLSSIESTFLPTVPEIVAFSFLGVVVTVVDWCVFVFVCDQSLNGFSFF
jgi:hypothetical protein